MRLTVGPLPPAVYWRRRVVVLGAGLLFLIVVAYSCSGPDEPGRDSAKTGRSPSPSPSVTPSSTSLILTPESDQPTAGPGPTGVIQPAGPAEPSTPPTVQAPPPPAEGACTDQEMKVTPVPARTSAKQGSVIQIKLRIRNISDRTCTRDVGADLQELYIARGAEKVWSSDICGTASGSDVRTFPPSIENEYQVDWNGRDSSRCDGGVASGPYPEPGEYQLFARLGTRISDPVKLTITR